MSEYNEYDLNDPPEVEIETNRMRIARSALQGMLSTWRDGFEPPIGTYAIHAVHAADALLAELAKPQEKP